MTVHLKTVLLSQAVRITYLKLRKQPAQPAKKNKAVLPYDMNSSVFSKKEGHFFRLKVQTDFWRFWSAHMAGVQAPMSGSSVL